MSAPYTTSAEISRALLLHVVEPSRRRPFLEITTPTGVFHMVEVTEPVFSRKNENGELLFVSFLGKQPIGKPYFFVWPPDEVVEPAFGVTKLEVWNSE